MEVSVLYCLSAEGSRREEGTSFFMKLLRVEGGGHT